MTFTRKHVLFGLVAAYVLLRLGVASTIYTEGFLLAAVERRVGDVLPERVCYRAGQDERGYLSSLYAIAPSMLVREGTGCAFVLGS
jgi:hypothetical protein